MRPLSSGLLTVCAGITLLTASAAEAGHRHRDRHYAETYRSSSTIVYARVTAVRPLIERVRTEVPVRECYETTAYAPPAYGPPRPGSAVGGTIAGGVIGGVIGDRFGGGEGRDAMRLFGALVGAAIGHDAATRRQAAYYPQARSREGGEPYPVSECTTRYESRIEERTRGYEVAYVYEGREYFTETATPPGDRIPIEVSVRPAF